METDGSSTVEVDQGSPAAPAAAESSTPAPSGSEQKDVSGSSSPETGKPTADSRETLLQAVRKVVSPTGETPAAPKPGALSANGASPAPNAKPGEPTGPLTQAEFDSLPQRTKKRIDEFRTEIKQLQSRIGPLEAQAKTTNELQSFLKQADIGKEDFGLLLDLGAAMRRGDFKAFLEGVAPYVKVAQEALGVSLPEDLQRAVQQGHMTEEAARYTAQQRGARQLAEAKAARATEQYTAVTTDQERARFTASVEQAVRDWETGIRKADPDYARKEPVVRDLLPVVVQERGPPRSPAEAIEIAKAAYERANAFVSRFVPQPRQTRQVPSSLTRVNGATPQPKSMLEAARFALERTR
jgi:hypothetical protein